MEILHHMVAYSVIRNISHDFFECFLFRPTHPDYFCLSLCGNIVLMLYPECLTAIIPMVGLFKGNCCGVGVPIIMIISLRRVPHISRHLPRPAKRRVPNWVEGGINIDPESIDDLFITWSRLLITSRTMFELSTRTRDDSHCHFPRPRNGILNWPTAAFPYWGYF